ncbi:FtsX-like permease family protein, partial [Candidatus Parcubacteria bacterium]
GPWEFAKSDNRALLDQEAIAVDRLDLPKLGNPKLGQIVEIGGRRVRIGAVTNGARGFQGTLVFANLELTREIAKVPAGRYSAILVRFRPGVDKTNVIEKMRKILRNCSVYSSEELSSLTQRYYLSNTGIGGSFGFSTVIAVLIGVVIITLTMYSSVLNRQRDFAVIRALGARKGDIVLIVLTQAFLISLMGILLGFLLLSFLFRATLNSAIPSYYPTFIPPIHALLTILFSLFGSFFALRKALKAEPASVFH